MRGVSNRIIRKLERQSRQEINRTGRPQRQLAKSHRERSYIEQNSQSPYINLDNGQDLRHPTTTLDQHMTMQLKILENFRSDYISTKNLVKRAKYTQSDELHTSLLKIESKIKQQKQFNEQISGKIKKDHYALKMHELVGVKDRSRTKLVQDMENRVLVAKNLLREKT